MKTFIEKLLSSEPDSLSSKRFIALIGFFMVCFAFVTSMFMDVKIKEFIWDGMIWIILSGLGLSVVDKITQKKTSLMTHSDITTTGTITKVIDPSINKDESSDEDGNNISSETTKTTSAKIEQINS